MASNKKNKEIINPILRSRRHEGRILAFQVLYSFDINQINVQQLLDDSTKMEELENFTWKNDELVESNEQLPLETIDYARFLIEGTLRNLSEIDELISTKLRNWELDRISAIDKAVVRFATFSLLYENDLDSNVIIDEAIEIVKEFGAKDSYKFVNGILDAIKKDKKQG